ncbi:MAG TPA: FHIPEP family type III secretion protein [Anaerolineaceae bacterium]|nr:FHIPEP family type III secretion protein [Anaerolineaceae bacterium]
MKSEDPNILGCVCAVAPTLYEILEKNPPLREEISRALSQEAEALLRTLGLGGNASCELAPLESSQSSRDAVFRLFCNGKTLRYPSRLPGWVYAYLSRNLTNSAASETEVLSWLVAACQAADQAASAAQAVEFFRLACREILSSQAGKLVALPQVNAYLAALTESDQGKKFFADHTSPPPAWIEIVMKTVVDQGISLADTNAVIGTLLTRLDDPPEDAGEALIAELSPRVLEIHIPEVYLRTLILTGGDNNLFPFLRDGLFLELGMICPTFQIMSDDTLVENSFAFRINHLLRLPVPGLPPGACLVNDEAVRIDSIGIPAAPAINPATDYPACTVSCDQAAILEAQGWTTWNPGGFLILCLASALRQDLWRTINLDFANRALDDLEQAFPEIVAAARDQYSLETITRILRRLVEEGHSIRNLRQILERLVDYSFSFDDAARYTVLDDRPIIYGELDALSAEPEDRLLAFVRSGLKGQITFKIARMRTMVVYLLENGMEQMISAWKNVDLESKELEGEIDAVIEVIRQELNYLPPTAQTPALLTSVEARPKLHGILRHEFPRLEIICYHEVLPDVNIQPIARIALFA